MSNGKPGLDTAGVHVLLTGKMVKMVTKDESLCQSRKKKTLFDIGAGSFMVRKMD
jgi:hypothetical protein